MFCVLLTQALQLLVAAFHVGDKALDEGAVLKGGEDPEKVYMELIRPKKIALQLKYVRERSLYTDIKIIVRTFFTVLSRKKKALSEDE